MFVGQTGIGHWLFSGCVSAWLGFSGTGESCLMRSQSGGGETLFFSARLLCLQEIQKVAFILQSEANIALFRVS